MYRNRLINIIVTNQNFGFERAIDPVVPWRVVSSFNGLLIFFISKPVYAKVSGLHTRLMGIDSIL